LETLNIDIYGLCLFKNSQLLHQILRWRAQRARDFPEICAPLRTLTIDVRDLLPRDFDTSVVTGLQNYGTSFVALFKGVKGSSRTSAFDKGWLVWKEPRKLKFP
jgi:hypothetical protein